MNFVSKPPLVFYQKLGELFYAIAASDNIVHQKEYLALKEVVNEQWKDLEFGNDAEDISQMKVVFDWFDYEQLDAKSCFQNFKEYYKYNSEFFTPEKKQLILKTANAIAHSFAEKNKSELIMLARLQILLQD